MNNSLEIQMIDNNLFVEFMGIKHKELCHKYIPSSYMHIPQYFKYNTSFDWLIPVLEKIKSLGYNWDIGTYDASPYHFCKIDGMDAIDGISPLDTIYGACIEFIKWYNKIN